MKHKNKNGNGNGNYKYSLTPWVVKSNFNNSISNSITNIKI
jgi:hypothetical protein